MVTDKMRQEVDKMVKEMSAECPAFFNTMFHIAAFRGAPVKVTFSFDPGGDLETRMVLEANETQFN